MVLIDSDRSDVIRDVSLSKPFLISSLLAISEGSIFIVAPASTTRTIKAFGTI